MAHMQLPVVLGVLVNLARKHDPVHNRAHLQPHVIIYDKNTEDDHIARINPPSKTDDEVAAMGVITLPMHRSCALCALPAMASSNLCMK